ncbi:MAG: hypothetical protein AAGB48_01875 [Planctomycetota bacterium]
MNIEGSDRIYGKIVRVKVGGVETTEPDAAAPKDNVTWDLIVMVDGVLSTVNDSPTFVPVDPGTDIVATQEMYADKLVDIIRVGKFLYPMIHVAQASQECSGGSSSVSTAGPGSGGLSLNLRIRQIVAETLAARETPP